MCVCRLVKDEFVAWGTLPPIVLHVYSVYMLYVDNMTWENGGASG